MDNLQQKCKKHYEIYLKIVESVNITSQLINELGQLPKTGIKNIDNLHPALIKAQIQMLEIFEPIKE